MTTAEALTRLQVALREWRAVVEKYAPEVER